ncbi:hypothetical protein ACWD25_33195, partial [Streptomyces sp. NPDC002920]
LPSESSGVQPRTWVSWLPQYVSRRPGPHEANQRLIDTVGQGGANFVQNAILGPLADKRTSTIDRIAISIGRAGTKPTGLEALAACTLNQ